MVDVIAGVDFSLTSTGFAIAERREDLRWVLTTGLVSSKGKTADSIRVRAARQQKIVTEILTLVWDVDLVVIEGLFGGVNAGALIDRAGGWWRIVQALVNRDIPVVVVAPTSAKLFLTGKGNADKGSMVRAAGKLWPEWEPSGMGKTEDEADAIALVSVGLGVTDQAPFDMSVHKRTETATKLRTQLEDQ